MVLTLITAWAAIGNIVANTNTTPILYRADGLKIPLTPHCFLYHVLRGVIIMTKEQIIEFEYCKNHLKCISGWTEKLPFKVQQYGCSSSAPNIEHTLESIHREMFEKVILAMNEATDKIQGIIDEI